MKNNCCSPSSTFLILRLCVIVSSVRCTMVLSNTREHPEGDRSPQTPPLSAITDNRKTNTAPVSPTSSTSDPRLESSCKLTGTMTEEAEDTVTWSGDPHFCYHEWRVVVPEHVGLVVEFHSVEMTGHDFLEIYSPGRNASGLWRNFTEIREGVLAPATTRLSLAPLLLYEREMVIYVHGHSTYSNFNLSYTAVNETLPAVAGVPKENPTESAVTYNCSGVTRLPRAIICDGLHQCAGGEDEANCPHSQQGCGNWIPYNHHCLKVQFVSTDMAKPGHSHITMPLEAEHSCQSLHNATLATLPDQGGIRTVTHLIHRSGFQNAVVGIRKLKPVSQRLKHLYRYLWQWGQRGSPVAYEQERLQRAGTSLGCAVLVVSPRPYLEPVECILTSPVPHGYVCMRPNPTHTAGELQLSAVTFSKASTSPDQFPTKVCADGSLVQTFHCCHWKGMEVDVEADTEEWSPSGLNLFQCHSKETVHYSLLCDGKGDCHDQSDEWHCTPPHLSALLTSSSFICRSGQAVSAGKRCDGVLDCFDESDEESCVSCGKQVMCRDAGCVPKEYIRYFSTCPELPVAHDWHPKSCWPAAVRLEGYGMSELEPKAEGGEGLFCCREGYCIPSYLLNNGERDCRHGEDEGIPVQNVTCPGFYRCQGTGSCLHTHFVCDGVYHCPNKDDEMYCHLSCPVDQGCTCEGQAYRCSHMIDPRQHLHVRYLDLNHATGVSLENVHFMEYLFYLNLSFCHLAQVALTNMPQLQTLDLSFNSLTELHHVQLRMLTGLRYLDLSNNPFITSLSSEFKSFTVLGGFRNLRFLKMVSVSLKSLEDKMFAALPKLESLDIRSNPVASISKGSLQGLRKLKVLYTDESKLCCRYFHSSLSHCFAPVDELSSCSDLLAQNFFRVCLWIISVIAITGNVGVLVYRLLVSKHTAVPAFRVLVMNLCASDLLMGIYMVILGAADAHFRGMYVAKEPEWTHSPGCVIAGVLSFVSSEVSAFVVCLITLDRVLVICFPLKPRLHLSRRVTVFTCCAVWLLGVALAAFPLLSGMEFYGQNGLCLPLPITRKHFSGQAYAFSIFIVLNFVLFQLIGVGQVLIYRALVQQAYRTDPGDRQAQDLTIARRLFLVVVTDFCCWFPIGLLGILASSGVPVSGQVTVWAAVFVLPVNSALNPFLYTLNHWHRRRRERSQGVTQTLTNSNHRH